MRKLIGSLFAGLALLAGPATAQDYPTQPITMIVPFSAGGPTDTVARLVAESMSKTLGQTINVENVGGAGGTLGATRAAQAAPDGYTLLLHHIGMATAPSLYKKLNYDAKTSFAPIGLVTEVPMTIVARPDFEPTDLKSLVEYVKANKDTVTYAHAGIGSASQLCGMLLMKALGAQVTTVPYKGAAPAMTDIMGSQVDFICDQTTNTTTPISGNKVKAFAAMTEERLATLPDLPTAKEGGLADVNVSVWHGLYAPAGTPEPVITKLSEALKTALADETVKTRFAELGTAPVAADQATPQALADKVSAETDRWAPIIKEAGVFAE